MTTKEKVSILNFVKIHFKVESDFDFMCCSGFCCAVMCAMRNLGIKGQLDDVLTELGIMAYKPENVEPDTFWWPMEDFETRMVITDVLIANLVNVPLPLTSDKG